MKTPIKQANKWKAACLCVWVANTTLGRAPSPKPPDPHPRIQGASSIGTFEHAHQIRAVQIGNNKREERNGFHKALPAATGCDPARPGNVRCVPLLSNQNFMDFAAPFTTTCPLDWWCRVLSNSFQELFRRRNGPRWKELPALESLHAQVPLVMGSVWSTQPHKPSHCAYL